MTCHLRAVSPGAFKIGKELRLQGISTIEAANRFAPYDLTDFNKRFGKEPVNPHDAHRPCGRP